MPKPNVGRLLRMLIAASMIFLAMGCLSSRSLAANVALGKPVFTDWNNDVGGAATDGDYTTAWTNSGSPAAPSDFIGVDLGAPTAIKYARVIWSGGQPTGFTVEVATSIDSDPTSANYGSGDWNGVYYRFTTDPQPGSPDLIDLTKDVNGNPQNLSYRYIRIYATDGPSTSNRTWGVAEFQVLNAALPKVTGTVTYNGASVAGAMLKLSGPAPTQGGPTTQLMTAKSDASGAFSFAGLDPGAYTLTALAPGQYAPATASVTVADADVSQPMAFTTAVVNVTAPLPAYSLDFVATPTKKTDGNATSNGLVLPSDELPAGDAVWNTATALPVGTGDGAGTGGQVGPDMPKALNFYFPPTADGRNNVINAGGMAIPFAPGHYTAVYVLQVAADRDPSDVTATLDYTDGTAQIATSSGNTNYHFSTGVATTTAGATGNPGEDEVVAFSVDKRYAVTGSGATSPQTPPFNVFMRTIPVDPTRTLTGIQFSLPIGGGTIQIPLILGWSADALEQPPALASVSGTVKGPAATGGNPVTGATVSLLTYRLVTDATGKYAFNSLPAGDYTITAGKPANYPPTPVNTTLAAGEAKVQDIQFLAPIPLLTGALTAPTEDMISSDANMFDYGATGSVLGAEYLPAGLYSPDTVANPPADPTHHPDPWGNTPNWEADTGAPGALAFDFGDPSLDSPAPPGDPNNPIGGVPNSIPLHDAQILAPPTNISNCYMAAIGVQGVANFVPTLHYTDGTTSTAKVNISDWYGTPTTGEMPYLKMHGRHTGPNATSVVEGDNGVAGDPTKPPANIRIKVITIPVDKTKILHDITFDHGDQKNRVPMALAISWETVTPQPASSDVRVTVKKADGSAAAGAWVTWGPYSVKADANGVALLRGVFTIQPVEIGAFLSGVTQQKRETITITPGQKMPTPYDVTVTLPSAAPTFVQLPLAFDYDNIATPDMPGDFYHQATGGDAAFMSESIPASGALVTENNIPFRMPHTETGYMNLLRPNGETWNVTPGHYSALNAIVLGKGVGAISFSTNPLFPEPVFHHVTLKYDDGTTEQVQTANVDWISAFKDPAVYHRLWYRQVIPPDFVNGTRRTWGSDSPNAQIAFEQEIIPINASKVLVSITTDVMFQQISDNDFSFLCATLEANDVAQSAAINGRVLGRPLGADGKPVSTAVPLGQIQVIADPAHMAYTNADGTFRLENVPLNTTSLSIVPLGTGILTKSVPVTLTAGDNNLPDLDAGTAVTQVYCILGATNQPNGLNQYDGVPTPYARDSGRPGNYMNVMDSGTSPITIGGKSARVGTYASDYFYFKLDPGWLFRGRQGANGLDPSTFALDASNNFVGKVAPHLYMRVEYFDRGTDTITINYNRMQGNRNTTFNIPTYNMTDAYRTPQVPKTGGGTQNFVIAKTGTNTWKTAVIEFNPDPAGNATGQPEAFGAYKGQNLEADFRISPNGSETAEAIRSVVISTANSFVLPVTPSATDALREASGLLATNDQDLAANDVTGPAGTPDQKVTIEDAVTLLRQGKL